MLHKTIKYTNIDGKEVSEDYWFRITKESMAKKAVTSNDDNYFDTLSKLKDERDGEKIMKHFDDILSLAVGKREDDLFIQSDDIVRRFKYSGAYESFFWELLTMGDSGAELIAAMYSGLNKDDVMKEVAKLKAESRGTETVTELPNSGVIEGTVVDAEAQADKPQPTPFPQSLQKATESVKPGKDEDPAWIREMRQPTRQEMIGMSKEDMQLLFKMREAGALK